MYTIQLEEKKVQVADFNKYGSFKKNPLKCVSVGGYSQMLFLSCRESSGIIWGLCSGLEI